MKFIFYLMLMGIVNSSYDYCEDCKKIQSNLIYIL